jgi:hypothetical protein
VVEASPRDYKLSGGGLSFRLPETNRSTENKYKVEYLLPKEAGDEVKRSEVTFRDDPSASAALPRLDR